MLAEAERQDPDLVRADYERAFREMLAAGYTAVGEFHYLGVPEALAAVAVVLAAPGYPDDPQRGVPIGGVEVAGATGALVFHAGTALRHGELVSAGGRVLDVVGTGDTVSEAREQAYAAVVQIDFPGAQFRTDIAAKAVHVAT